MRDLKSRLRDIVRQDVNRRPEPAAPELTYVDEERGRDDVDPGDVATALGGRIVECAAGACIVIDRVYEAHARHGRRQVGDLPAEFTPSAPITLFDHRAPGGAGWADRIVFFDTETTGLSGGAGTLAFLAGCGWFEGENFRVRQFLLAGPGGERAQLAELTKIFDDASLVVTYNGRTFDVPLMDMRWAFHRTSTPTADMPHLDMLPPARRLWGSTPERSCSLSSLERAVLGFHRLADVPGFEIPGRYFQFVRTNDARAIAAVLDHNRHDVISLAALMSHALWLVREGPLACREPVERLGLGRLYERAGDDARAIDAYEMAARGDEIEVRRLALARLAHLLRRDRRYDAAAAAWQGVFDLAGDEMGALSALDRRAIEALAIHHEHRARNLPEARRYAEVLRLHAKGAARTAVEYRVARIRRKLAAAPPLSPRLPL